MSTSENIEHIYDGIVTQVGTPSNGNTYKVEVDLDNSDPLFLNECQLDQDCRVKGCAVTVSYQYTPLGGYWIAKKA